LLPLVMAMQFEIRRGIVRKGELSWVGALLLPNTLTLDHPLHQ
jgi:hypothetical protein